MAQHLLLCSRWKNFDFFYQFKHLLQQYVYNTFHGVYHVIMII